MFKVTNDTNFNLVDVLISRTDTGVLHTDSRHKKLVPSCDNVSQVHSETTSSILSRTTDCAD
jgi:hypothetical protein